MCNILHDNYCEEKSLKRGKECDGNFNNPVYETAKKTLMYRTVLWERERVGRFGRMALKHVKYHI